MAESTVHRWSNKFNWKKLAKEYDDEMKAQKKDRPIELVEDKTGYRPIVARTIQDLEELSKRRPLRSNEINSLRRMVELDVSIIGEKVVNEHLAVERLAEMLFRTATPGFSTMTAEQIYKERKKRYCLPKE